MFFCFQSLRRPANLAADIDGAEGGSDYGDWGENDDWSVDSFAPPSSSTRKSSQKRPENKKVRIIPNTRMHPFFGGFDNACSMLLFAM